MERKSSKAKFYLIGFALLLLATLGGVYYYMVEFSTHSLEEVTQNIESKLLEQDNIAKQSQLDSANSQIKLLKAQKESLQKQQDNAPMKLRYSIKPKDKIVAHCVNMKVGRFAMPKNCSESLKSGINEIIKQDNTIVAFEISGIVDTRPYAGLSPELKQEGLASFRAKEAIMMATRQMPSVAAFEGLSQQRANQRGFVVRAFYVENK
ncbi:hypothetical protein T36_1979 [Helicobacter cinaedi]|uniref:hypothetical protein n=1 Tax=Helicobacter cinaedi TaxID=213 RepID=UPI001F47C18F|nr:hypothetical protein [Helicobacter cinaedi]BDB65500.1 hypothetical protein T36_1979 [Helicobacter cinaedi]